MKYRVAIRAFTLRRDVAAAHVLGRLLEKAGCKVFLGCARNIDFILKEWKPHAVIVNTVGKIGPARKAAPHSKIIQWPGEGGEVYEFSDAALIQKCGTYNELDLALLWGKYTKNLFEQDFGKNDDKLKVCGNPRLDLLKYLPEIKKPANTIGILGRFNCINHFDKRPTISTLMNNPANYDLVSLMCKQFVTLCQVIDFIVKNTDFNISLRPHPLEAPEGYSRLKKKYQGRLEIDDSLCFAHWVANQKFLITPASTTFIEAYLLGVPSINIDNIIGLQETVKDINELTALAYEMSYNPKNMDELYDVITSEPERGKRKESVLDKHLEEFHNYPSEGSAMKKGVDAIMKLLENSKFPTNIYRPKCLVDLKDWYKFSRAMLGGDNHQNFNYKSGYHKFPAYYEDIVDNIMQNRPSIG